MCQGKEVAEMVNETLMQILLKSNYTVVLSGYGQLTENGYPAIRDGENPMTLR